MAPASRQRFPEQSGRRWDSGGPSQRNLAPANALPAVSGVFVSNRVSWGCTAFCPSASPRSRKTGISGPSFFSGNGFVLTPRPIHLRLVFALLAALLSACGSGASGLELLVELRTDFVPGADFDEMVVRLPGQPNAIREVSFDDDFLRGGRIAEFRDLAAGDIDLVVEMHKNGSAIMTRTVAVKLRRNLVVSVVMTRSCANVECPGSGDAPNATACVGGVCVDPGCTPETPESCPSPECSTPADCDPSGVSCQSAICLSGTCLYADDDSCEENEYCDVDEDACVAIPGMETDAGMSEPDAGPTDAGPPDSGMGGMDAGPPLCGGEVCESFEFCVMDVCTSYPTCFTTAECDAGEICRNRHCLPEDLDPDGDGSPAGEDCDESDEFRYPGADERCNVRDDDCDDAIDEGNPGLICADDPAGGECIAGSCGCPAGRFDLDGMAATGCECDAAPTVDSALSCAAPINLGTLNDSGQMDMASGNVLPAERQVWYRFQAQDVRDTSCDNFHVRVRFIDNPNDAFRLSVFRGGCASGVCSDSGDGGFTDFNWATDFRRTQGGRLTGQCPCSAASRPGNNVARCSDDSAEFFVRVTRRPGVPLTCEPYTIEFSNGLFDT